MNDWVFEPDGRPWAAVRRSQARFPIARVFCVGRNYADHVREMGEQGDTPPVFFSKTPQSIIPTPHEVPYPRETGSLHYEVELVAALKGRLSQADPDEALTAVYGYAVGVDLTRRDVQTGLKDRRAPWEAAKAFEGSAPLSAIAMVEEVGHPATGAVQLWVNGHQRQNGDLTQMTLRTPDLLAELSRYFDLLPGDLVFTGTPSGVGPLSSGDRVTAIIDSVGRLDFEMTPQIALAATA